MFYIRGKIRKYANANTERSIQQSNYSLHFNFKIYTFFHPFDLRKRNLHM